MFKASRQCAGRLWRAQNVEHLLVQGAPSRQDGLRRGEVVRAALQVGDERPSLLGDQPARGHVPGFESQFPVAVEAGGGHVAEVEGGRTEAANPLRLTREASEVFEVVDFGRPGVVGEARHEQGLLKFGGARDAQRAAVQTGAASPFGAEHFVAHRVVDRREARRPVPGAGDGHAEDGHAVGVVDGSVERVHVPAQAAVPAFAAFLREDAAFGPAARDLVQQEGFGLTVNLGDEVYHAFELNVVFLVVAVAQDFARSAGEGFDVGKGGLIHGGIVHRKRLGFRRRAVSGF